MFRTVFKSKLHRATVTEANLNYVGSITIDEDLLDAADICVNEKVQVVNNNNGARLETYAIPGPRGSGVICLNGAAARLVQPGDRVIIITYAVIDDREAKTFKPTVVFLDDANRIAEVKSAEKHGEIR
jgi:aspartate 1-decarboxylase